MLTLRSVGASKGMGPPVASAAIFDAASCISEEVGTYDSCTSEAC